MQNQFRESVTLHGEVSNIDLEQPIVTLFYGKNDGGFAFHEWDNFTLNEETHYLQEVLKLIYRV